LLAAAVLSFELGAVTSASSQPVVPFACVGTGELCCSAAIIENSKTYSDSLLQANYCKET